MISKVSSIQNLYSTQKKKKKNQQYFLGYQAPLAPFLSSP